MEIYVNAEIDDGTDLSEYMKILKSEAVCNNNKFPVICDLTNYYKNGRGRNDMCQVVENYAKEYAKEYAREVVRRMIQNGDSDEYIVKITGLKLDEVSALRTEM